MGKGKATMARKRATTLKTFEDADTALLALGRHQAVIQKAEATMNLELQTIRDTYERKLEAIRQEILAIEENLELFAQDHKEEFGKKRSKDLVHGRIGFRYTPPRVALLGRGYTWEKVIELLKTLRFGKAYLRTVVEVDKERILADHSAQDLSDHELARAGMRVAQRDTFAYEIKWETINQ